MMQIIGGEFKKRKLYVPKTHLTRPSKSFLRESLFNICAHYVEGAVFLDLFAGSGAVGFEALSRGATKVIFVENQRKAIEAIKKNAELLNVSDRIEIIEKNVFDALAKVSSFCDIIFADPPYDTTSTIPAHDKLFEILEKHPILNENGHFFLETHRKSEPYSKPLQTLKLHKKRNIGNSQLFEYRSTLAE